MKLIKASYEILTPINGDEILRTLEIAGRTCYKSEDKITPESAKKFVATLIKSGHHSVIEHNSFSVRFIVDRGVSHEIVRHRLASFSQESTRYCNYSKDKFEGELIFIIPCWLDLNEGHYQYDDPNPMVTAGGDMRVFGWDDYSPIIHSTLDGDDFVELKLTHVDNSAQLRIFFETLQTAATAYVDLVNSGWKPQEARSVLPNALKTEIVVTANLREWRTIFTQRCALAAHPQMREVMIPLLKELKLKIPVVFDDLYPEYV